jgi:hypothetical protein
MSFSAFKSIDHVLVRVEDAQAIMNLFTETFGLPVSWPLQSSGFATYGWVTLGNTNLEFWASSNNSDLPSEDVLPLFHGLALEPFDLAHSIKVLGERGINCKAPRPYVTQTTDGRDVTNFTNSVVLDVSSPLVCIFFCEWGAEGTIFPWKQPLTTVERKLKERQQLSACDGGKLGITGLVEVEMLCTRIHETKAQWLAMTGRSEMPITQDGVELSFQSGAADKIDSIVIGVRSLAITRQVLAEAGLLGECFGNEVSMAQNACSGLHFRFRQI